VRKVLLPLLHLPTLTSIKLSTFWNFAWADLAGRVNLKELEIESLECSNGVGKFSEALPTTPVMLERLAINKWNVTPVHQLCHAQRPDGKPIIDLSSLKEVTAEVPRIDSIEDLFGICRNLHKIDLSIERSTFLDYSCFKGLFAMLRPSLLTLVDIDIEYDVNYDYDGFKTDSEDDFAGLFHELEKMVGQNVVETIKLAILVYPGYDCTRWGCELDDILMGSPEGWPALKKVSLKLDVVGASRGSVKDKALRELPMTKLVESKRVQFDLNVWVN